MSVRFSGRVSLCFSRVGVFLVLKLPFVSKSVTFLALGRKRDTRAGDEKCALKVEASLFSACFSAALPVRRMRGRRFFLRGYIRG